MKATNTKQNLFDYFKYNKYMSVYPFKDENSFNEWRTINMVSKEEFSSWFDKNNLTTPIKDNCPWMDYLCNHYKPSSKVQMKYSDQFCVLVDFIIEKATFQFRQEISSIENTNKYINSKIFVNIFKQELTNAFSNMISPTLTLEMNVARLAKKITGKTSDERYKNFINLLSEKIYIQQIFNEYPVLLNRIIGKVNSSSNELLEVYSRIVSDYSKLCEQFIKLEDFLGFSNTSGDSHLNGRHVRVVKFKNLKLVYKPRNLKSDIYFQQLLLDLNKSAQTSFKAIKILNNQSYGWSEFINYKSCTNKDELVKFYKSLGNYIMLLYLFNGADFHIENIISNAESPILVDLESIFHINPFCKEKFSFGEHTVMDSSILPYKLKFSNHHSYLDISALGYDKNQIIDDKISENSFIKQDDASFELSNRKIFDIKTFHPIRNNFDLSHKEIISNICNGFEELYNYFILNNSWIYENSNFQRLIQLTYRCILRPTNTYVSLLRCSYHPDYLRNEVDLKLFLNQKLWESTKREPFEKRLICIEVSDIIKNDIPVFYSKSVASSKIKNERTVSNNKYNNIISIINTINSNLSNEDLYRQLWLIKACMNTITAKVENNGFKIKSIANNESIINNYNDKISTILYLVSIKSHNNISFQDYKYLGNEQCTIINQNQFELFNGDLGTLLYLLYFSSVNKKAKIKEVTISTLMSKIDNLKNSTIGDIGGYIGLGGVIYTYTKLYKLTKNENIIPFIDSLVNKIAENINQDEKFDILYGSSGAILSLLTVYEVFKKPKILATCIKCAEHLVKNFKTMKIGGGWENPFHNKTILGGYSHGVSGIGYALAKLSKICNQDKFASYANLALDYEDSLFNSSTINYQDLRSKSKSDITAWCNGLVGIALTRIDMLENNYLPNRNVQFKNEIKQNLNKILDKGLGNNHSLCHGDASALEYLFQVSSKFPNIYSPFSFDGILSKVVNNIAKNKQKNGIKFDLFSPGLFLGSIGLSYQLLRFNQPEIIGNLLLLN